MVRKPKEEKGSICEEQDSSILDSGKIKQEASEVSNTHIARGTADRRPIFESVQHNPRQLSLRTSEPAYDLSESSTPSVMDMEGGFTSIGKHARDMIKTFSKLETLNLDSIPHPRVIFIGDQSSGKSSVMTALAEIHIPRDSGCCTRCPANIITSEASTWSCTISLSRRYKYTGDERSSPFPYWEPQNKEVVKFQDLTSENKLENAIKWAQIALLNPDQNHELFIPETGSRAKAENTAIVADYSPNIVVVNISGPELPELSFFDLPGLISSRGDGKQYLVQAFQNLTVHYIQEPNSLILFALSMSVDSDLSKTKGVIEDCSASSRCLGVLTKPDTMEVALQSQQDFEDILRGKSHRMGHGYLVTKQPGPSFPRSQQDYHFQARQEEEYFFKTNALWKGDWARFREKCGTEAMRETLSRLLAKEIAKAMPDIEKQIENRRRSIDEQLQDLPSLPHENVQLEVSKVLHKFSSEVENRLGGEYTSAQSSFHGDWTKLSSQFYDLIIHLKPIIAIDHPSDKFLDEEVINLCSDAEDDDPSVQRSVPPKRRRLNEEQPQRPGGIRARNGVPNTPQKVKAETPPRPPQSRPFANAKVPPQWKGSVFAAYLNYNKNFTSIGKIRDSMNNGSYSHLPHIPGTRLYESLCRKAVEVWKSPLLSLLLQTKIILREEMDDILHDTMRKYQQTCLVKESRKILHAMIDDLHRQQQKELDQLYDLESDRPFTLNGSSIRILKQKEMTALQKLRATHRAGLMLDRDVKAGKKRLKADVLDDGYEQERKDRIEKMVEEGKLPDDNFQVQLEVAAYIRAYYQVAANRFADNVCLNINNRFFRKIITKVNGFLETELGIWNGNKGKEECSRLMVEDTEAGRKRIDLLKQKKDLDEFSNDLAALKIRINYPVSKSNEHFNGVNEEDYEYRANRQYSPVGKLHNSRRKEMGLDDSNDMDMS